MRTVIVDDHAAVRQAVARLLDRSGLFELVGEAADGQQALDLAAALAPDLVLMDVRMPVLDGIAATRLLLQSRPSTVVLLCTTLAPDDLPREARTCGARAVLAKERLDVAVLRDAWLRAGAVGQA